MTGSNSAFVGSFNLNKSTKGKRNRAVSINRSSPALRPTKIPKSGDNSAVKHKAVRFDIEKKKNQMEDSLEFPEQRNEDNRDLKKIMNRDQQVKSTDQAEKKQETLRVAQKVSKKSLRRNQLTSNSTHYQEVMTMIVDLMELLNLIVYRKEKEKRQNKQYDRGIYS
eukprot:IDg23356t1